jgi:hypothetical protein
VEPRFDAKTYGRGYVYELRAGGELGEHLHAYVDDPNQSSPGNSRRISSFGARSARVVYAGTTRHVFGPRRVVATRWPDYAALLPAGGGAIYAVTRDGRLVWYWHDGFIDASQRWIGPVEVATLPPSQWKIQPPQPTGGGAIEATRPSKGVIAQGATGMGGAQAGGRRELNMGLTAPLIGSGTGTRPPRQDLLSSGRTTATVDSAMGRPKPRTWTYVGGGEGVLYAIKPDGTVLWLRHGDPVDGGPPASWSQARTVASGWDQFAFVFAGGEGIIYTIESNGNLWWQRHLGFRDGSTRWTQRRRVGDGWGRFQAIFSGGLGDIYAVNAERRLIHLRHLGYQDGDYRWTAPADLGRVSDPRRLMAILPTVPGSNLR